MFIIFIYFSENFFFENWRKIFWVEKFKKKKFSWIFLQKFAFINEKQKIFSLLNISKSLPFFRQEKILIGL